MHRVMRTSTLKFFVKEQIEQEKKRVEAVASQLLAAMIGVDPENKFDLSLPKKAVDLAQDLVCLVDAKYLDKIAEAEESFKKDTKKDTKEVRHSTRR